MFTSEMFRSSPKTFLDLKERNYTLYMPDSEQSKWVRRAIINLIYENERLEILAQIYGMKAQFQLSFTSN